MEINQAHLDIARDSKYVRKQKIKLITLDSISNYISNKGDNIMLKIDTQGYELNILQGGVHASILPNIMLIYIELSIIQLYKKQELWLYMINYLKERGFEIWDINKGIYDLDNHQLYQWMNYFIILIYQMLRISK